MDKIFIAITNGECGIGSSLDEAMKDLQENTTHSFEFEDVSFYEATKLKVKQSISVLD